MRAGTRPFIDLSQARADFANAEVQVVNADNAYQRSKLLLNQAMGVEGAIDYDVPSEALPPQPGEDGALEPLLQIALEARPEVASATEQVKAQQLLIRSARGAYAPSVQQVRVDVDQALLAIRAAKAAVSSSHNALTAARQRLSLAEGRYRNGSGSVIELGDAQIAAANAAAQVVQTDFQLSTARAQFVFALARET